jgi:hypothetical protein
MDASPANSTLLNEKVPLYRLRPSKRTLGILGILGILFSVLPIFSGLSAVKDAQFVISVAYCTAIIFTVIALGVFSLFLSEIIGTERKLRRLSLTNEILEIQNLELKKQNSDLLYKKYKADERFSIVAKPFNEVSVAMTAFEASVSAFIYQSQGNGGAPDVDKQWEEVRSRWRKALLTICDAAACVLPIKKGHDFVSTSPICSAHIAVVELKNDDFVYEVVRRSSDSHSRRYVNDRYQHKLSNNMMYQEMIIENDIVVIDDLDRYVSGLQTSSILRHMFSEPTKEDANLYKSCLIAPILGTNIVYDAHNTRTELPKLVGIFFVDSLKERFFDKEYDKTVINQLANHALTCFRVYWEATKAREFMQKFAKTRD